MIDSEYQVKSSSTNLFNGITITYSTDMNETVKSPYSNGLKIRCLSVFRQTYSKSTNLVFKNKITKSV